MLGVHSLLASKSGVEFLGLSYAQWDLVGTIATSLSFVVAATAAAVAVFQLRHSRRIHRDQTRPYMVITIEASEASPTIADIVIKNIGTTPAYDLSISVDPPFERVREDMGFPIAEARVFKEVTAMWAPGFELRQYFDSQIERTTERKRREADPSLEVLRDRYEVTLAYANAPRRKHRWQRKPDRWVEKQLLDANWGAGTVFTDIYGVHHAAKALREIEKVLKRADNLRGEIHAVVEDRETWKARRHAWFADRTQRHESLVARMKRRTGEFIGRSAGSSEVSS